MVPGAPSVGSEVGDRMRKRSGVTRADRPQFGMPPRIHAKTPSIERRASILVIKIHPTARTATVGPGPLRQSGGGKGVKRCSTKLECA